MARRVRAAHPPQAPAPPAPTDDRPDRSHGDHYATERRTWHTAWTPDRSQEPRKRRFRRSWESKIEHLMQKRPRYEVSPDDSTTAGSLNGACARRARRWHPPPRFATPPARRVARYHAQRGRSAIRGPTDVKGKEQFHEQRDVASQLREGCGRRRRRGRPGRRLHGDGQRGRRRGHQLDARGLGLRVRPARHRLRRSRYVGFAHRRRRVRPAGADS